MMQKETQQKLNRILELVNELEQLLNPMGGGVISLEKKPEEKKEILKYRPGKSSKRSVLTDEIKEKIMVMVADGKNSQTISEKLGLKYQTVWAYVAIQRKKTGPPVKGFSAAKIEPDQEDDEEEPDQTDEDDL
jgi:DNA-binding CsgD family transcriptional regulator